MTAHMFDLFSALDLNETKDLLFRLSGRLARGFAGAGLRNRGGCLSWAVGRC